MALALILGSFEPMRTAPVILLSALVLLSAAQCNKGGDSAKGTSESAAVDDPLLNKGIGPVKAVTLGPLDGALAGKGSTIFQAKCSACHKLDEQVVGPALRNVTKRRSPEWIMNMIVNTNEMVEKDPIAKRLVAETFQKMTFQDVSQPEARSVLEYFRKNDASPGPGGK